MSSIRKRSLILALLLTGVGAVSAVHAADPVRGKQLYWNTNGASKSCGTSGCHNGFPTTILSKVDRGTSASVILSAISGNKGNMGQLSTFVSSTDAADIAAYIANPAAGDGAATLSLSASALTFASQAVGTASAAQTITVSNTGTAALTFTTMTFGGTASSDYARAGTCAPGGSVAAGGSCTVQITFTPSASGTRSATLTIGHNAAGGSSTVTLAGTGAAAPAAASVSPGSLSFTQMVGATSAAQTVTVSNTGGTALTLNNVTLGGTNPAEYAIATGTTCTAGAVVNGGASCVIRVTFTPSATGARPATLSIAHSASVSAATVALNGTGSTTAVPSVSLSSSTLTYADQTVGSTSAAQIVTLSNTGSATLTLSTLTISGAASADFTRAGSCAAGGSIAAGGTCTVQVAFAPTAVGARSATLTIASNASNGNATLALSGTGIQVSMAVNPTSASLVTEVGQISASVQVAISNAGASNLSINAVTVTGPFQLRTGANACSAAPIALMSGQSCNLFIAFQPTTAGTATGEVAIASNASATPTRITLTGQGQVAAMDSNNMGMGGCSLGAPDQLMDPLLATMFVVSLLVLIRRRRSR